MAQYIKFRLNAAKLSVSMAFVALLGGLAARANAQRPQTNERASAAVRKDKWLPVLTVKGLGAGLQSDLAKIETTVGKVYDKDQAAITSDYAKEQKAITAVFDKTGQLVSGLQTNLANNFYDKDAANSTFMKIVDANAKFLPADGTAANSNELGGFPASAFIQGTGAVGTGAVSITDGTAPQNLLPFPGTNGAIIVVYRPIIGGAGGVEISIINNTSTAIPAVQTVDGESPTASN